MPIGHSDIRAYLGFGCIYCDSPWLLITKVKVKNKSVSLFASVHPEPRR